MKPRRTLFAPVLLALPLMLLLSGCNLMPVQAPSVTQLVERPAEKALLAALRAYEDGQYAQAEQLLNKALQDNQLASPQDQAVARKHLAFIYCTSGRLPACETQFRAARAIDPSFALTKSEAGHPQWGPVYQRSLR